MNCFLIFPLLAAAQAVPSPPKSPLPMEYQYVEEHFRQWIHGHSKYSAIEALVSSRKPLEACMALTAADGIHHYCNSQAAVNAYKAQERPASLVKIDARTTEAAGPDQPVGHAFAFQDRFGTAIRWRFLPASEPSKRGGGLTPLPEVPGLRLHHRRIGTTAGSGTAVQIGDQVVEAQPWPEISSPPYFVAFRGTYSIGVHMLDIRPSPIGSTDVPARAAEVRMQSNDHVARLTIAADGSFAIYADSEKLASGTVNGGRWQFKTPDWAKQKRIE